MRKSNTILFDLIKSLSSREVAYFRKNHPKKGEKKGDFLMLFDAILKQKEYDESKLKRILDTKIKAGHFYKLKSYLLDSILTSLTLYSRSQTIKSRVDFLILQISSAFQRGLYPLADELVRKALGLAQKTGLEMESYSLLIWDLRLMSIQGFKGVSEKKLVARLEKLMEILRDQQMEQDLVALQLKMFYQFYKQGYPRAGKPLGALQELIDSELLGSTPQTDAFWVRNRFHNIQELASGLRQDWQQMKEHTLARIALYEDHPEVPFGKVQHFQGYLKTLGNSMLHLVAAKDYSRAELVFRQLNELGNSKIVIRSPMLRVEWFALHASWSLILSNLNGVVAIDKLDIEQLCARLRLMEGKLNFIPLWELWTHVSVYWLLREDYSKALSHITRVINHIGPEQAFDIHLWAQFVRLLLNYHLGHSDVIPALGRAMRRTLSRDHNQNKDIRLVVGYILEQSKGPDHKVMEKILDKYQKGLLSHGKNIQPFPQPMFMDPIVWLEAQLHGTRLAEEMETRYKKWVNKNSCPS